MVIGQPELPADAASASPAEFRTDAAPTLLFVDPDTMPRVTLSWTDKAGEPHRFEDERPYAVDAERTPLGGNISCYAAVGGTRLTKGAGHPRGVVVRVGFYKIDNARAFFEGITADSEITVTMEGIRFNQPVEPNPASVIQHLKYDRGEMQACGLPGDAREQFNTADPRDTLNDRVRPGIDTRLGVLSPNDGKLGSAAVSLAEDGSVTMTTTFRYPALRNLRDPWKSDLPNTFLEPYHFHIEFEVLPEGVEPLDPDRDRIEHIDGESN